MAVIELTKQNFQSEVAESKEKVLIDFWASWCGPCRMVSPIVDEIAEESPAGVKVCKVNVDEEPELASRYRVMNIPNLVYFVGGEVKGNLVGVQPKAKIMEMIEG